MSKLIPRRTVKAKPAAKAPGLAADEKATSPAQPTPEPLDLWKLVQGWVLKHFGVVGAVVLAIAGLLWTQWDHMKQLPGIEFLVARISEKSLPEAEPGEFNVAIAHLAGDDDRFMERKIRTSLVDQFPHVHTMSFDRLVSSEQGEREGHKQAQTLLRDSGFDVIVWGECLKQNDESLPRLHLTVSRDPRKSVAAGRYQTTADMNLPPLFWRELTSVLGLIVATNGADFASHQGQYQADKLEPFIQRVRQLLAGSRSDQWSANTRANVQFSLGSSLEIYGTQSGMTEPLEEAVAVFREVLTELTRADVPLFWATVQNNLGVTLTTLGERQLDSSQLQYAVAAIREALKERTREKVPLDWAFTQNSLGNAMRVLGERQSDPALLHEAVTHFREALKEFTREKAPLDWAMTQNNLGLALTRLGERESGFAELQEAVLTFRDALNEFTRQKAPLNWATTQSNLGIALESLGERESDPARLHEAVIAYHEALKEFTRERMPLKWAATQNNLGIAFEALGARESNLALLEEAASAYQASLAVARATKTDYYAKRVDENLRRVKDSISQHKGQQMTGAESN